MPGRDRTGPMGKGPVTGRGIIILLLGLAGLNYFRTKNKTNEKRR